MVLEGPEEHVGTVDSLAGRGSIQRDVPPTVIPIHSISIFNEFSGARATVVRDVSAVSNEVHILGLDGREEEGEGQRN